MRKCVRQRERVCVSVMKIACVGVRDKQVKEKER
jgi:hypothetical protein